jgi:hypothetical protein
LLSASQLDSDEELATTVLASGRLNRSGDTLTVELVELNEHPSVIMIR